MSWRLSATLIMAAVLVGAAYSVSGQDQQGRPPSDSVQIVRDIEYAKPNGQSLRMDLYIPKAAAKPMPVVLWVHGGGWHNGNKSGPIILPLLGKGMAVASINYRLTPDGIFPDQIFDCKAAVRWLRAKGGAYGLDPNRIGAAGASAGGHLVALLGTTADNPSLEGNEGVTGVSSSVQAVCDFFGPTNLTDMDTQFLKSPMNPVAHLLGGPIVDKWTLAQQASPVFYVTPKSAPFFIIQGDADQTVPPEQSTQLEAALKKANVPSTLYMVKGGRHGVRDAVAFGQAEAFLQHYLKVP